MAAQKEGLMYCRHLVVVVAVERTSALLFPWAWPNHWWEELPLPLVGVAVALLQLAL